MGSRAFVERGPLPGRFVEVHVEQGPVLERAGAPLGVVTGIVGYTRREVVFEGAAGHAGTTPMAARDDALSKAAEFILRVRDAAAGIEGAVATVGFLEVEPGAANVIPGRVRLTVDARAPDAQRLDRLLDGSRARSRAAQPARRHGRIGAHRASRGDRAARAARARAPVRGGP